MSSQLIQREKRSVSMAGANNIFGTIGSGFGISRLLSRMDFIPADSQGHTIKLVGQGDENRAVWIGLDSPQMQYWAYVFCSPLAAVIDRLAEAENNGRIRFVDEDNGVPIKNVNKIPRLSAIRKLLKKPNPWQTWYEFDIEQTVISKVFGYCPVFAIGGNIDRAYARALVNLAPIFCVPIRNNDFDLFGEKGPIDHWELRIFGKSYEIPTEDVMIVKDGFLPKFNEFGLPLSKISGLDFSVSNICAAMEADNVLLKKKGPLGIFSYDPGKDMAGSVPLEPSAKDDLQSDLAQYGLTLGQLQYVISKMPVKWNAMSFNLRDLMTKETIRMAIDTIADRFGYPAELMSGKNATYENRNSSEKWLYNNNVIPCSVRKSAVYNGFFSLEGGVMEKNYDHVPVLQEDIVQAGEAFQYEAQGLLTEWTSGMITWNEWQIKRERDPKPGMDIYYPEYIKKFPNMAPQPKQITNGTPKETPPKNSGAKK